MKFSLVCLLPASLWMLAYIYAGGSWTSSDQQAGAAILTWLIWFATVAVLCVYWAARIVRYVMRGGRG